MKDNYPVNVENVDPVNQEIEVTANNEHGQDTPTVVVIWVEWKKTGPQMHKRYGMYTEIICDDVEVAIEEIRESGGKVVGRHYVGTGLTRYFDIKEIRSGQQRTRFTKLHFSPSTVVRNPSKLKTLPPGEGVCFNLGCTPESYAPCPFGEIAKCDCLNPDNNGIECYGYGGN